MTFFNWQRIGFIAIALLLIGLSWWNVAAARSGLTVRSMTIADVPLLFFAPKSAQNVPGVLIAHGYSGSKQLMLTYAHVLAHAGYGVMLLDFNAHGANPQRLEQNSLQKNLEVATSAIADQPEVDASRLALLGHSMGSGAVMSAGIANPDSFKATVAVSPTGAAVTPELPRNLQLQAGSWEGGFVANAQRVLSAAGGENPDAQSGRAREFVLIPNVEHITILFNSASHNAARRWLDATFGVQNSSDYVDRRILWQGVHLIGWLLGLIAVAPLLQSAIPEMSVSQMRSWSGLVAGAIVALVGLIAINSSFTTLNPQLKLQTIGGVQVGGAVALWFLLAGITWLITLGKIPPITGRSILVGAILFAVLWVALAIAQFVFIPWLLIPQRLTIWAGIAIASLPWFLAAGIAQQSANGGMRFLWWFGLSAVLIAGFIAVLQFLPALGFMFILLPLFPVLIAVLSIATGQIDNAWSGAIASAAFFAWLLAAGFPLA